MIKMRLKTIIKGLFMTFVMSFLVFTMTSCRRHDDELDKYDGLKDKDVITVYDDFNRLTSDVEEGTYYIYFGKPTCPWCRQYLPIFASKAKEYDRQIYYFNADYIKGTYEVENEDGTVNVLRNEAYAEVVNWIKSTSPNDIGINFITDSQGVTHPLEWLFVPKIFKVVDGNIVMSVGEVDGHNKVLGDDGKYYLPDLTDSQRQTLESELDDLYR